MPVGKLKQGIQPSRRNLARLCLIRSIVIVALLLGILWLHHFLSVALPLPQLAWILVVAATANVLIFLRLRSQWPVGEGEFFANLLLDVVFLTLVLYFTGGSTNPIVSLYLIPLIISAAVLRPALTWGIALISVACYTLLLSWYRPLELFTMSGHGPMNAHFIGMWINFVFSAVLIAWFVVRMAATLREQSRAIARSREEGLRNEQIIGIANIAAATAHEMRTPLATMAVSVEDIGHRFPELKPDLEVLEQQIERCDLVLRELVTATARDGGVVVTTLGELLRGLLERWSLVRPEVELANLVPDELEGLAIRCDRGLQHALMNFLNNAADASPEYVSIGAEALPGAVNIMIEDRGEGIPAEIADELGKTWVSRKQGGLGLGILLGQASIERLGGEVTLTGVPGRGTRLEIRLPVLETANDE
ncbi:MAG: ATP-binding protein [Lysobacterales bacterium]|jgi:two-component system sensor histidine kinase RegB